VNGLHSPDAEHAILGSLLLDNNLMHAVELTPEDFSGAADRAVYRVMLEKWGEGEPWDVGTLSSSLNGQLDSVGEPVIWDC